MYNCPWDKRQWMINIKAWLISADHVFIGKAAAVLFNYSIVSELYKYDILLLSLKKRSLQCKYKGSQFIVIEFKGILK
jgi:hypothetical protein